MFGIKTTRDSDASHEDYYNGGGYGLFLGVEGAIFPKDRCTMLYFGLVRVP